MRGRLNSNDIRSIANQVSTQPDTLNVRQTGGVKTDQCSRSITVEPGTDDALSEHNSSTLVSLAVSNGTSNSGPACYYIPGQISTKKVHFLLDSGCTGSLIGKHVFDTLPLKVRADLRPLDQSTAQLADGSMLPIYGKLQVSCKVRDVSVDHEFFVARLRDDAILGLSFLERFSCSMQFGRPILQIGSRELICTDRWGKQMASKVQLVRPTVVPPISETMLICKLNTDLPYTTGLVESCCNKYEGLILAATLCCPDNKRQVLVRCMNVSEEPVMVQAGTVLGVYQAVDDDSVVTTEPQVTVATIQSGIDNGTATSGTEVPDHVKALYDDAVSLGLTTDQQTRLGKLLCGYADVFSSGETDVGLTTLVKHSIPVHPGTTPVRQPPRRLGPEKDSEVERQVTQLQQQGLIEPSDGAWSSPVVLVRKKDGKWRLCVDYRRLNAVTCRDAYPLPRIDDSLDSLAGSCYFSTLDLLSGYWQVPLDDDAQEKSAFVTRGGLWRWKVLPFGLTSAPASFERLMERVLGGLQWKTLLLYLDDVIVFSRDFDSHLDRLELVLQRFRSANLKLKPSKCELFRKSVSFLGHRVSQHGVSTDPQKVESIREWPTPRCISEVRTFLGMVGYYRRFCPAMATVAKPLHKLTSKDAQFKWTAEEDAAFTSLKDQLTSAPVLGYPNPQRDYILDTDASNDGAGAVLSQIQQGQERVIAYFSKTFSASERNYCVTRKELLAAILSVKHFRSYLYGHKFRLRTDHASLIWLIKRKEPSAQIARWLEFLEEFQFSIEHRPGRQHSNADGMSRQVCRDCRQCERIEMRDGGPTMCDIRRDLVAQPAPFEYPPSTINPHTANQVTETILSHPAMETDEHTSSGPSSNLDGVRNVQTQWSGDAEANVEVVPSSSSRSYRGSMYAEPTPLTSTSSPSQSRPALDSVLHDYSSVYRKLGQSCALMWQVICLLFLSPIYTVDRWTRLISNQLLTGWSDIVSRPNIQAADTTTNEPGSLEASPERIMTARPDQSTDPTVVHQPTVRVNAASVEEVVALQQQEPSDVATIYSHVKGQQPISPAELDLASPELRKLASYYSVMGIRPDGVLVVRLVHNTRSVERPVCPLQIRESVLWEIHKQDHAGIMRTIKRAKLKWFWPGITSQTRRLIRTCEVCQLSKHSRTRQHPTRQHLYSGRPWQRVAVDLVGPLPETPRKNKWILVLTDHFTRWQDALPIPDGTTPVVAKALDSRIFCYFGIPEQLHSDQGSQFESGLMRELCQLWGVKKTRTTPYHPQGNGMVERQNRTLGDSLRSKLLGADQTDWDQLLPNLMRSFRATPHSTTQETPNYLMFGRETRVPDGLLFDVPLSAPQPVEQYAVDLQRRLQQAHDLLRADQKNCRTDDLDEGLLYAVGDTVYLNSHRRRQGQAKKLSPQYVGPYRITACYPNHTYEIARNGQHSIQHERQLKLHTPAVREEGRAPVILEPTRRPNMRGRARRRPPLQEDDLWDFTDITAPNQLLINPTIDPIATNQVPPTPATTTQERPVPLPCPTPPSNLVPPQCPTPPSDPVRPAALSNPTPPDRPADRATRTSGRTRNRPPHLRDYVCD